MLWADERKTDRTHIRIRGGEKQLLDGEGVLANLSTLDKAENQFEIAAGEKSLLQVYFGWKTASGTPMVVETYYPTRLIDSRASDQRHSFLPLLLGGLALLTIAWIPLARALTHRLKKLQAERENLLERVIASSDIERRRIAAEVHDGAVQELIGITLASRPPPMNRPRR